MALFAGAQYVGPIPSTNFTTAGTPKIGAVVHVIVGSAQSALSEFGRPGAELSAHFIVCGPGDAWPDGHILQVLDTDLVAYAQEAGNWPPTSYFAIEFSGFTNMAMSAAQVSSGASILAWGAEEHGFGLTGPVPHGKHGVTTHCNPNGTPDPAWGDHSCPGPIRLAQIPEMIAQAVALTNPPTFPEDIMALLASDPAFAVRYLYRICLHREADAAGFTTNVNYLNGGGTLNQVMANLQDSPEGQAVIAAERKALGLA
jgi:hypothetical protein